ncbi:Mitochondrial chaperone Frataxin [Cadophora gregata]|uniref:Mitochondrial chaperone Frataxin n=1 Tax=Cadophora gregata TaxID=51156 RepID=UPI0026DB39DA|nr:Mitochondrial chaperone Frataxin [Cadophora gregata]KAK0100622.1 Mitochondrial chaperone Frataxin [Cadophora gregata]KAK0117377.1 Mitochondrial chaperone Frataxin [Cadophora gregata f. sp. sojae]
MVRPNTILKLSKLVRPSPTALRTAAANPFRASAITTSSFLQSSYSTPTTAPSFSRAFSTTPCTFKGLSPESADPPPKESEPEAYEPTSSSAPADISIEEYHVLSDAYLNGLIEKLEQLQEEREEVDVEYSAGVLTLAFPPNGTYVVNKQPPNKQIWLSSPLTGPKRYDYVLLSEGQDAKEGTGRGEWVYLRDGSSLTELIEKEIGVTVEENYDGTVEE